MFDELKQYKNKNHFFYTANKELENVCNAPKNKSGVYIVYELKNGRVNLVYIASSGKVQNNGKIKYPDGSLYENIVNGYQFGNIPRKKSWKQKLIDEKIDALDVYWYETFDSVNMDIPVFVQSIIIQRFFEMQGHLPLWNKEF